ncbi:alpha/beta fold hydrolase [Arthrobacter zhaoguopingii]|uniref:alpha/beta fold hydrolase n=1 Tax=Arthrobacter zhaoguopingii TaxID=2681491 RepID=UPI00135A4095|nr:alpha/beta hydrolase [Arthrobacter zhaoguopingii]
MAPDPTTSSRGPTVKRTYKAVAALVIVGTAVSAVIAARRHTAVRTAGTGPGVHADDGVLLHTETGGKDGALTVLFAHGFASRAEEYRAQRDVLGEHARVVLFDQRGHGSSGWGGYRSATIEQLGHDLGRIIDDRTGTGPVLLVAHSMGGMAAITLAGQRPELFGGRIVGVALLSTAAGRLPRTRMPARVARVLVASRLARAAAWMLWFIAPAVDRTAPFRRPRGKRWLVRLLFGGQEPSAEAEDLMQDMWVKTPQSRLSAFYPAMAAYNDFEALKTLKAIPVLVMAGTKDRTIPPRRSELLARRIGENARLILVEGAGHMVNLTHVERVNDALLEFLHDVTGDHRKRSGLHPPAGSTQGD